MSNPSQPEMLQFLTDASCRHIPSFFLGGLFLSALTSMVSPSFFLSFFTRYRRDTSPESISGTLESKSTTSSVQLRENRTLFFLLSFFFASASIAHFASLPTFPLDAKVACAFVIAWAGVATQSACLVGMLILLLELRRLGIYRWEIVAYICALVLAFGAALVTNILGTGRLQPAVLDVAFCIKQRILVASVATSLIYILIACYTLFRMWSLLAPHFMTPKHRFATVTDARILRAASLITLELLVIYPNAMRSGVLLEFLPYSLGALLVLGAFSMQIKAQEDHRTDSIPPSSRYPSMRSPPRDLLSIGAESQWRESKQSTGLGMDQSPAQSDFSSLPALHSHPFSARSLSDPTMQGQYWPNPSGTRTARSSRTIDTVAARSIRNAIVQTVKRAGQSTPLTSPVAEDSESTTTAPFTASTRSFIQSQGIEPSMPSPAVMARPRLVVVTSNNMERSDANPDSSVLRPIMQGSAVLRLTPTFVSPSTVQYPTMDARRASSFKTLPHLPSEVSRRDSRRDTFSSLAITNTEEYSEVGTGQRQSTYTFGHQRTSTTIPTRGNSVISRAHRESNQFNRTVTIRSTTTTTD